MRRIRSGGHIKWVYSRDFIG